MHTPLSRYICACVILVGIATTFGASSASTLAPTLAPDDVVIEGGFDMAFFREFVRNGYEQPLRLQPIRRLLRPPNVYLKTVDESGRPIDEATISTTEAALLDSAIAWGGNQFGIASLVKGKATKEEVAGWITVKWAGAAAPGRCGQSTVGSDGGFIELDYLTAECSCGGPSRIYPRVVRHELGHAFGYYHTDSPNDVMYGAQIAANTCDLRPSARERQYAKYVYGRPPAGVDPASGWQPSSY